MKNRKNKLYLLLSDIENLNSRYYLELDSLKRHSSGNSIPESMLEYMAEVIKQAYMREVEQLSEFRQVEFAVKASEAKARAREQSPWRRCWLYRLIFQPVTNRAQDIIEKSAELQADELHSEQERLNTKLQKQIEAAKQLENIIKAADEEEPAKVFKTEPTKNNKQLPGQLELIAQSLRKKQKQ